MSLTFSSQGKSGNLIKNTSDRGEIREFDWPKKESGQSVIFCFMSKQCVHSMIRTHMQYIVIKVIILEFSSERKLQGNYQGILSS